MPIYNYLTRRYKVVLDREPEMMTKTRIRILLACFLGFIGLFIVLLSVFLFQEHGLLLVRNFLLLLFFIAGLLLLNYKRDWTLAGHAFILTVTLMVLSNVLLFRQGINIITVQLTLLVLSVGYYILGEKWGRIYSLINIVPTIIVAIIDNYLDIQVLQRHLTINTNVFAIMLTFNFLILYYIHYSFFKAFRKAHQMEQELKETLKKAALAAQELAEAKTNFLSTMSHELRTPLNAVIGMTNILLMETPRTDQMENLNVLRFSAENLMSTVNDILDFNKIDSEKIVLEIHPFKPLELLKNIYGAFSAQAKEKGIGFHYTADSTLSDLVVGGDQARLTQILFNLVGNAIKFTSIGEVVIDIRVAKIEEGNVQLLFKINDTGIGIPKDRISIIFDPFTQGSTRTNRKYHGTGLGLTIAFRLVKLLGGKLKVHTVEGKGSMFTFKLRFPISILREIPDAGQRKAGKPLDMLKVLVVEDEPINVMVIRKILDKWGIVPDVAVNGSEGVDAVAKNSYDVVLMDLNMPVMDGFAAAKKIRRLKDGKQSNVYIIAVTASIGAAKEQIASSKYIDDCLLKPFKPEHLREKLEAVAARPAIEQVPDLPS